MKNRKEKEPGRNRGSAPLPEDAFNRGDGAYNKQKASDKGFLLDKIDGNMAGERKPGRNPGDASVERMDALQKQAEKERRVKKPGSQSNSSSGRHNSGKGGGK